MLANVPTPGRDFGGLVRYLIRGRAGAKTTPERVIWSTTRNLTTEDPKLASKIMTATAHKSIRVERPVYHAIISWADVEQPSIEDMDDVVTRTLADMGLSEHQALIVAHGDTTNPHVHMLVNRVHPESGVAWSTSFDYPRLEQSVRAQARDMGFIAVPGRHADEGQKREKHRAPSRHALKRAAQGRDLKPWPGQRTKALAKQLEPAFESATSWDDLNAWLADDGVRLEAKGQGLILTDHARTGYAKLSSLGANVRAKSLNARFGETFADFIARTAEQAKRNGPALRPLVSEVDIAVGLYRMGLAGQDAVTAAVANRDAKLSEAPLHTRETRALKATLQSVTAPAPKAPKPKAPDKKDPEPEPQR